MRPIRRTLFLFLSFALVTSCGGSSSSNPSPSFDSELPITIYQSEDCLEPSEYEATIGLAPEDIQVLSACIHKDSSKNKLILETKPDFWVQVLCSDQIAQTTATKFFGSFRVIGMEPIEGNKLFQAYTDKWKNLLEVVNRFPINKDGMIDFYEPSKDEQQSMLSAILKDGILTDFYLSPRMKSDRFDLVTNQKQFTPSFKIKLRSSSSYVNMYDNYSIRFSKPEAADRFRIFDYHSLYRSFFPFKEEIMVTTK